MTIYRMIPEKAFTKTFEILESLKNESDDFTLPLVNSVTYMIQALYNAGHRVEIEDSTHK